MHKLHSFSSEPIYEKAARSGQASSSRGRVVVGMSGGVDSSVSALLLKEQGYDVIGLFMKNWEEEEGSCQAAYDYEDVVLVCEQIGIPCYSVNFAKEYKERVFAEFLEEYKKGRTPNPDILCNKEIKFGVFFEKAQQFGADYLATGHYARVEKRENGHFLLKGKDPGKDQSYFLHAIPQNVLKNVLFPIGDLEKPLVRELAKKAGLATAKKKDSTGICFIGERDFSSFISSFIPHSPGKVVTTDGKVVGEHQGIHLFTLGQRKGMSIGGAGEAYYVVKKEYETSTVMVAQGKDHPALFSHSLTAVNPHWILPEKEVLSFPFACKAKIRYRQEDQECVIERQEGNTLFVSFPKPQRAITPRQSIVFYLGDVCLGGAWIEEIGPSLDANSFL